MNKYKEGETVWINVCHVGYNYIGPAKIVEIRPEADIGRWNKYRVFFPSSTPMGLGASRRGGELYLSEEMMEKI